MKKQLFGFLRTNSKGLALISVLGVVTLATILILALFSVSDAEFKAAKNYSDGATARHSGGCLRPGSHRPRPAPGARARTDRRDCRSVLPRHTGSMAWWLLCCSLTSVADKRQYGMCTCSGVACLFSRLLISKNRGMIQPLPTKERITMKSNQHNNEK